MKTFEVKQLPGFKLIGVQLRTTNAEGRAMQEIPLFWERFVREKTFEAIPSQVDPSKIYGVYTDYDKDGYYSLIIGTEVGSLDCVPAGFVAKEVPAEKHAVLEMKGQVAKVVPEAWGAVWASSFPHKRKFSFDLEIYNMRFLVDAEREVRLCISVI
jgi:predicted transcriptional regulator YdeE